MNAAGGEWLIKAREDLLAVEKLAGEDALTNIAAFHAQQCAEKCLKAVLEELEMKVPRTHDLVRLNGLVQNACVFEWDEDILHELSTVYLESRYPGDLGMLPQRVPQYEDILRYQGAVTTIYEDVCRFLKNRGR
jgi:HEPN domain-containing protein